MTKILLVLAITCLPMYGWSQDSLLSRLTSFPDKVKIKTASLDQQLTRKTEQYLRRLIRNESRLKKKLVTIDSNAANSLLAAGTVERYNALLKRLKTASGETPISGEYLPYLDSLKGSLSFLQANTLPGNISQMLSEKVQGSLDQLKQLQAKLQYADQLKQLIQQRKEQIRRYLGKYTKLPADLKKIFADYSRQTYYYEQQIKEYKDILNDPDKMLKTALRLLNKMPVFADFMKKHSMLAGLFNVPGNGASSGSTANVTGLQTRDQVISILQDRMGGPNGAALIAQNLQSATQQVDDLRSGLNLRGFGGGELDMPNFKPNMQKTKKVWQRLEYGTNLQTVQGTYFFPITTDLGLSLGYRLNDKNVVGVGASYKVGWGKDIRNISISSQGAGLRSFMDIHFKKNFYISGGFELNHQPMTSPDSLGAGITRLPDLNAWQQSGLIGISKIISLKTKVLKKTKVQLLWDFLSYRQAPGTPPVKFRVGYSF